MNRRLGSGEWITRWMADNADVRTLSDAAAFLCCGVLFAALGVAAFAIGGLL